jgi:hypothetical protein
MEPMDDDQQPIFRSGAEIQEALTGASAYIHTLPTTERRIATMAAAGASVWEIAQQLQVSEQAIWRTLDGVIATISGREMPTIETGGLGSDTDPGVTGGYGDTGFGALDTEPIPDNTEPFER